MVKTSKGGKKKKAKKSNLAVPVDVFDLDSSSLTDLKAYVSKLEKELAAMRRDCAFYSVNKENIMNFLMTVKGLYASKTQASVVKNSRIDDLIEQLRRFPEAYNERAIISDKEKAKKKLEKLFNDFLERNTAAAQHFDEEYVLKQQISDMDKCLQRNRYFCESAVINRKELLSKAQDVLDNKYSELLENSLKQYVNESLQPYQKFNAEKIDVLCTIWNIKEEPTEMRESFLKEIKNMQDFFYEICSNNNEVIKMLRDRLDSLLIEQKKLGIILKEMLLENTKLKDVKLPGFYDTDLMKEPVAYPSSKKNVRIEKKFEKLQFQNEVLREQLGNLEDKWKNLKKQFFGGVRMAYQTADMKAHVIEEIIKSEIQMQSLKCDDSVPIQRRARMRERHDYTKDAINVVSLRVEDSDTLFVPPVYYDFWERSLKKQV